MLSSLFMAAFAAQVADDGFSKLQIFLQQLIDWGVSAGGRIIGAVIIFVVGRFLISFLRKMLARLLAKRHVDASIQSFVKSLVTFRKLAEFCGWIDCTVVPSFQGRRLD